MWKTLENVKKDFDSYEIEDNKIIEVAVADDAALAGDKTASSLNKAKESTKKAKSQWQAEIVFTVSSLQY